MLKSWTTSLKKSLYGGDFGSADAICSLVLKTHVALLERCCDLETVLIVKQAASSMAGRGWTSRLAKQAYVRCVSTVQVWV